MKAKLTRGTAMFVLALFFSGAAVFADEGQHDARPSTVVKQIRESQGLSEDQDIKCGAVTDTQLEKLGEAWMNTMHPDSKEHTWMDRRMGGEGSETLAERHRHMGASYLECKERADGIRTGGGYHMMGWNGPGGMMNHMGWFGYGGVIVWILILIAIAVVMYLVVKKTSKNKAGSSGESALDILKTRYAKGEISKDDFERMKSELG